MKIDWVVPGLLAAGPIPIDAGDLRRLHQQGIRVIMTLTEKPLMAQTGITPALLTELGMTLYHSPIPDGAPPTAAQAKHIVIQIDEEHEHGRAVYLHCHAGIGRTGTLLHAYFLMHGQSLADARRSVRKARIGCLFDNLTPGQRKFLEEFAAIL